MKNVRFRILQAGFILFLLAAGCSRIIPGRQAVYPVSGELFVRGQAAAGAVIRLYAINDLFLERLCPHAVVEQDGSFRLTTYNSDDGAPDGDYALTVTWPAPPKPGQEEGPDRFNGRFANRHQPVRKITVSPGSNVLERINLP
jgi:hypothetical protein